MKYVGAYEAKTHLPRLLREVAAGESITITKHGVPVAVLIAPSKPERTDAAKVIADWIRYRDEKGLTLGPGPSIREMIEEGRR
jgi:prevent-host-death family protein